jgi:hypothetical protein
MTEGDFPRDLRMAIEPAVEGEILRDNPTAG